MGEIADTEWAAIERRDPAAFVYAVRSTGVYCLPTCPARRPLRVNTEIFPTPLEAAAAGYRPCRRCRPDERTDPAAELVAALCGALDDADTVDVAVLAAEVGWSERHLRRMFRRVTGVTMSAYVRSLRAEKARAALRAGASVTEAIYAAGYGSARAFYVDGAPRLGGRPSAYRRGYPGETVRYTAVESAIGDIVVAATDIGVCAVKIGGNAGDLVADLVAEFPGADVVRDDESMRTAATAVADLAAGRDAEPDVPLDVRGTVFQARVWEAVRSIGKGTTRTYSEVARSVGRPGAQRAVGAACGANPVALLVPCHRVVHADGSPGGYRWGTAVKAALLAAEDPDHAPSP